MVRKYCRTFLRTPICCGLAAAAARCISPVVGTASLVVGRDGLFAFRKATTTLSAPARHLGRLQMVATSHARDAGAGVSSSLRGGPRHGGGQSLGIVKSTRVHAGLSDLCTSMSSATSLVGRLISVPYALIIDDDHSGCTCESLVFAQSARGCLVVLAGEKLWKPTSFVRRWLCDAEAQQTPAAWGPSASAALPSPSRCLRNRAGIPGQAAPETLPPNLAHGGDAQDESGRGTALRALPLTRSGVSDLMDESNLLGGRDEPREGRQPLDGSRNLSCISLASCEL